jgi:hypothetical protein
MPLDDDQYSQFSSAAERQRRLCGTYGFFLEQIQDWDLIATFTFKDLQDKDGRKRLWTRGSALAELLRYLDSLERAAGGRIAWVLVEDFGRITKRPHAHALIAGVAHLDRWTWWEKAFRQFGRARIEPYVESGGGAQYLAKHALTDTGEIHFGGKMLDERTIREAARVGRVVVAHSAEVSSDLFHMTLGRRKGR